jgi:hypothetical protein
LSVNKWEEAGKSKALAGIEKALNDPDGMPWYTFAGIGEVYAVFLLAKCLCTRKRDAVLTRSSHVSWREIADSNLIFIGPPKFNQQL